MNNPSVYVIKTKEEALAAGIREEDFDPTVHLYSETVAVLPPQTVTTDATAAEETDARRPKSA